MTFLKLSRKKIFLLATKLFSSVMKKEENNLKPLNVLKVMKSIKFNSMKNALKKEIKVICV